MYWLLAIILLGWLVGGLVNYLSDFLPIDRKIVRPYCLQCHKPINFASYIIWPKRCENCGWARRRRAIFVHSGYIVAITLLWLAPRPEFGYLLSVLLFIYFGLVIVIDFEHRLILHPVSIFGAILGLFAGTIQRGITATVIGGLAGFIIMYLLYQGGRLFIHFLARRRNYSGVDEALGFGDVILAGVIGLLLGWPVVIMGLVLAIILAGVISLLYLVVLFLTRNYRANATIAYGPYLVASAFLLLYGKDFLSILA
jgi:leader peptidase (prepilin peptidase) / N-methyltransferase